MNSFQIVGLAFMAAAATHGVMYAVRKRRAAATVLARQYEVAPRELIAEFIQDAESDGHGQLVQAKLSEVRRLYGTGGVRVGHVMWIIMVVEGSVDRNAAPPSFEPPANASVRVSL